MASVVLRVESADEALRLQSLCWPSSTRRPVEPAPHFRSFGLTVSGALGIADGRLADRAEEPVGLGHGDRPGLARPAELGMPGPDGGG